MHRFTVFSHSNCASHTLSKNTNHEIFLSNMICSWSLIHRKFESVPYPFAAKSCVSGVKSCMRNSQIHIERQIPYLRNRLLIYAADIKSKQHFQSKTILVG